MNPPRQPSAIHALPVSLLVVSIYVFCAVVFGSLLIRELQQIEKSTDAMVRERGATLFRLIELTRDWNSQHGGVYVPVTESMQPNPYLKHPRRDVLTTDGQQLTMVNPAFMTRQIAEIAERAEDVRFHITSLNPIRPANTADAWEAEVLASFEKGGKAQTAFFDDPHQPVHRFMAPLLVKQPCLKCHAEQGYKLGDVRGGISVTMPAQQLLLIRHQERERVIWIYLIAFLLFGGMLHFLVLRSRRYVNEVEQINRDQEELIRVRTSDLETANAGLAGEISERSAAEQRLRQSENRYRAVVDSATDGVMIIENSVIVFINHRLGEIVGRTADQIIGTDGMQLIHPDDRELVAARHERRQQGKPEPTQYRVRLHHTDDRRHVIADLFIKLLDDDESAGKRQLVTMRDVTAELKAERDSEIADAVFENAAEAILVTDAENKIVRVNAAFSAITGYTPHEVLGHDPKLLKSSRHDPAFYTELWDTLLSSGRWQGEIWNRRKNGELYLEWLSITRVERGSGEGSFVATFTDITQRKEAEELIRHKATYDALTELPNRTLYHDRLHGALASAARYQRRFAVIYADLDHFKAVNDTLGHAAGDALLVEASRRMLASVRESDTIARLGGDEFAFLLPEVHSAVEVEDIAQRAINALARPFELSEGTAQVSGSLGISLFPDHGTDAESLLRHADLALYASKEGGRNRYTVYSPLLNRA